MLTQSEIDAITKEAEKFAMQYLPPEEKWKEHHEIKFNEMTHYYIAGATEERQRAKVLLDALEKAVEIIKIWHNFDPTERLTDKEKEQMFALYYTHAPEMKPIREALNTYNKNKPNDRE